MRSRRTPADLRTALWQQTRAVAEAVAQLLDLGAQYRRAASGPGGEPNRANEALLALERAKEALHRAVDCYEHPEPLEVGLGRGRRIRVANQAEASRAVTDLVRNHAPGPDAFPLYQGRRRVGFIAPGGEVIGNDRRPWTQAGAP